MFYANQLPSKKGKKKGIKDCLVTIFKNNFLFFKKKKKERKLFFAFYYKKTENKMF